MNSSNNNPLVWFISAVLFFCWTAGWMFAGSFTESDRTQSKIETQVIQIVDEYSKGEISLEQAHMQIDARIESVKNDEDAELLRKIKKVLDNKLKTGGVL